MTAQRAAQSDALASSDLTPVEQLRFGREVVEAEGRALLRIARQLDGAFLAAADSVRNCTGCVVVTGVGKAGLIGQKVSATLASTGTRSLFLHPSEALHGDIGRVAPHDLLLALSQSGRSEEVLRVVALLRDAVAGIVAITSNRTNPLGRQADVVLELGVLEEACHLGLAPTTSTTAMLAVGDALALLVSRQRGFTQLDFARSHPAGTLGHRLARVDRLMRPLEECRLASDACTVRECIVSTARSGRRTGAVMLVDPQGLLTGIFTDSDLARLLETRAERLLDRPVAEVMSRGVTTVASGSLLPEAIRLLAERRISELPVLDEQHRPKGLLDITDVVSLIGPVEGLHSAMA
jgi:arabinose-5-phosphate isomerase